MAPTSVLQASNDEVRFYGYVLTPGQVLGDYQTGPNTINTSEQAPVISVQPQNLSVFEGYPATFYITASGSPGVSYQWLRNSSPIAGATGDTFTLTAAAANNGDVYSCVVSNFAGSTSHTLASSSATLSVTANSTVAFHQLFTTRDGNRNNFTGTAGGWFTVGSTPAWVSHLGYYDYNGDGLVADHHVGIISGGTLIASTLVPAGTSALLTNGYRYVALASPILLAPNTLYKLQAECSPSTDPWPTVFTPASWDTYFVGTTPFNARGNGFNNSAWPAEISKAGANANIYAAPNMAVIPVGPAVVSIPSPTTVTQFATFNVTLSCFVNGQAPVTVQWYKAPGTLLTGQTNTTLLLANLSTSDSGDYYVIAHNSLDTVQSGNLTLVVQPDMPVSITQQPASTTVPNGFPASFSVVASGTLPIYYQWSRNGAPIGGATTSSYALTVAMTNNGDTYSCVASNFANAGPHTATSSTATLTVQANVAPPSPQFLYEPHTGIRDNFDGIVGGFFQVGASGAMVSHLGFYCPNPAGLNREHRVGIFASDRSNLLASVLVPAGTPALFTNGYAWVALDTPFGLAGNTVYLLGAEVFNADGDPWPDTITPTNWSPYFLGLNGSATCRAAYGTYPWPGPIELGGTGINNIRGAPNMALLLDSGAPTVVMPQTNVTQWAAFSLTLNALVSGQAPMTAQWYKAPATQLAGQTNLSLTFSSLTLADSGDYYLIAQNALGPVQSSSVTLTVIPQVAPTITEQPQPISAYVNQSARFTVVATGTPPLSYQWSFSGTNIPSATNTVLNLTGISTSSAGNYYVTVSNPLGSTNNDNAAILTVLTPPAGSYPAAVLAANPLVYYRFDDDPNGTTALNLGSLGSAFNGTYEGNYSWGGGPQPPTFPNFESTNQAVQFPGYQADVSVPALRFNQANPPDTTMAAWINSSAPQITWSGIIFYKGTTSQASGLGIKQDDLGNDILEYHWYNNYFGYNSGLLVPQNQWLFVALVVEANQAVLYLNDGSGMRSATNIATHVTPDFSSAAHIGFDSGGRCFTGAIDEAMIFRRALTPSEIGALYQAAQQQSVLLQMEVSGNDLILTWPVGTLQQADNVGGSYSDLSGAHSPYTHTIVPGTSRKFFRVRVN